MKKTPTDAKRSNQGLMMETEMITVNVLKKPWRTMIVKGGIPISRMVISLENLVVILPIGFESKNTIFARRTLSAI